MTPYLKKRRRRFILKIRPIWDVFINADATHCYMWVTPPGPMLYRQKHWCMMLQKQKCFLFLICHHIGAIWCVYLTVIFLKIHHFISWKKKNVSPFSAIWYVLLIDILLKSHNFIFQLTHFFVLWLWYICFEQGCIPYNFFGTRARVASKNFQLNVLFVLWLRYISALTKL